MKILFVHSGKTDYLQDLMYSGLAQLMNGEDLIEYPATLRYTYTLKKYPRNLGCINPLNFSKLSRFIVPSPSLFHSLDAVIVASCKKETFEEYLKIQHKIPRNTPIIFIDGGDSCEVGGDLKRENAHTLYERAIGFRPFDRIFKREYVLDEPYEKNVTPMPMCFDLRFAEHSTNPKIYNVSFWGVESSPIRTRALEMLEDEFDCKSNGTIRGQTFHFYKRLGRKYLEELRSCKVVLNFRGAGWDTLRFWETLGLSTFLISQRPRIMMPNPFVDGEHLIYVSDCLDELVEKCDYYLKHEVKREAIAKKGFEHLRSFHTNRVRASKLLSDIALL